MNVNEALSIAPEGWELISFDNMGACQYKRESHLLKRYRNGTWVCVARANDEREYESNAYLTAQAAIDDCRRAFESRREKLFLSLRTLK